ncbi:hypothetical protein ACFVIM_07140 [Streptomyces sp. NPDC057638]
MNHCPTCDDLTTAEREAERAHDHSRATDCRVLRTRHQAHHPDPQEN